MSIIIIVQSVFIALKFLCTLPIHLSLSLCLTIIDLFIVSIVLPWEHYFSLDYFILLKEGKFFNAHTLFSWYLFMAQIGDYL